LDPQTITQDDVIRVEVSGSSIKGYINGVEKVSATDTSITTGTRGGIRSYKQGSDDTKGDSYIISDLASATRRIIISQQGM